MYSRSILAYALNSEPDLLVCVLQVNDATLDPTSAVVDWQWSQTAPLPDRVPQLPLPPRLLAP